MEVNVMQRSRDNSSILVVLDCSAFGREGSGGLLSMCVNT